MNFHKFTTNGIGVSHKDKAYVQNLLFTIDNFDTLSSTLKKYMHVPRVVHACNFFGTSLYFLSS